MRAVERDHDIATKAREHLDEFLERNAYRYPAGSEALGHVREALKREDEYRADLVRPSHSVLAINRQGERDFSTLWGFLAKDRDVVGMASLLISMAIILGLFPSF